MASQPPNGPIPLAIESAANKPLIFNDEATRKKFEEEMNKEAKRIGKMIESYRQAEAISVVSGELAVNTRHIQELTRQLKYVTDCEVIKFIIKEHLDSLKNLIKAAIKEQLEAASKFLPITKLPSPTPWSIVKWIGKLIFGTAMPQIEATFKLIKQIISLTKAVIELTTAVQAAVKNLIKCAKELKQIIKDAALNIVETAINQAAESVGEAIGQAIGSLDRDLNGAITSAFKAYDQVKTIVGATKTIDMSSPSKFVSSFDDALTDLNKAGQSYMDSEDTAAPPYPVIGLQTGAGAPPGAPQPGNITVGPDTITSFVVRDGYLSEVSAVPAPPPPPPPPA